MRRAEAGGRRYRGRKRGCGMGAGQVGALVLLLLAAMLILTVRANCQWTGMDAGEQLFMCFLKVILYEMCECPM